MQDTGDFVKIIRVAGPFAGRDPHKVNSCKTENDKRECPDVFFEPKVARFTIIIKDYFSKEISHGQ